MIKKKISGETLKEKLQANARDRLHHFLLSDGTVRGVIVNGTRMINEMRSNHELGILETLVLGHAYLGATLMSANLKGHDRLSLQIECSGPIKGLIVETNAFNEVRGYLKKTPIAINRPLENFNLAPFFGAGFLSVTRYLADAKQPCTGKTILKYGNIAEDLAYYHMISEQLQTAFTLSVHFNKEGAVTGSGGLFLQVMPGAGSETRSGLEGLVFGLPSLGHYFSEKGEVGNLVNNYFQGYSPVIIGNRRVEFMCHCNEDKIRSMIHLLPVKDLKDILERGPFPVEIKCHHCNTAYSFNEPEIRKIYEIR